MYKHYNKSILLFSLYIFIKIDKYIELSHYTLRTGVEPAAFRLTAECSNQLSYRSKILENVYLSGSIEVKIVLHSEGFEPSRTVVQQILSLSP